MARSLGELGAGLVESRTLLRGLKPDVVVGFGGYPTVPPVVAARLAGIPIMVHEQNAVIGRANRLLLRAGARLARGIPDPGAVGKAARGEHVGNPVRRAVLEAVRGYTPSKPPETFNLLVFGGSQGARVFSGLIPGALSHLPLEQRGRIRLAQQARPEDVEALRGNLQGIGVAAEIAPFFTDMGGKLAAAHLVIARAGASTVSELAAVGRPAILVPYPYALDHDQAENARVLMEAGGCWLMPETTLTPEALGRRLAALMDWPDELLRAAEAAKAQGRPDAAERLADMVERVARA
jgi:UDP-N-acetylglucosamine--N-acetylmuramyl-(pentapeptide) pyrophosphoryl-undecaprenol N-acetylglucosamine transferase